MKMQSLKSVAHHESFLTEREQQIADQLNRLRDLQPRTDVKAGNGRTHSGVTVSSRTGVKDSHDR